MTQDAQPTPSAQDYEALKHEASMLVEGLHDTQAKVEQLTLANATLQTQSAKIRADYDASQNRCQSLRSELDAKIAECALLVERAVTAEAALKKAESNLQDQKKINADMAQRVKEAEGTAAECTSQAAQSRAHASNLASLLAQEGGKAALSAPDPTSPLGREVNALLGAARLNHAQAQLKLAQAAYDQAKAESDKLQVG